MDQMRRPARPAQEFKAICAAACLAATAGWTPALAQTPARPGPEQDYDIPAQPLNAALAGFARTSGVDILYENALGEGRFSAPLKGRMAPQVALRALLAGTGLTARFTDPRAVIVHAAGATAPRASVDTAGMPALRLDMAEVRASVVIGAPDRAAFQRYAQAAQADIQSILGEDPALRGKVFRLKLALTVSPAGRIDRVTLLQGSGDAGRDDRVRRGLTGRMLPPPPSGLADALYFEVATDRFGARG
ncbi:hypothetical protein C5708_04525 [Caulobacter sp. CCUG 60055]|uniref:TonB C-terminal domain-containing protein n=1 Tax=Caulobacter sp. CCUG 60055 TaxID=2100090 RepID=UPI001FA6F4A4|nr:TonB C-terminal domain-containing protein [Caulobacter sp. CCUG 60055]MCI3179513.1 hypothetical protein [Caulobacter sp. CCUG 60055]